MNPEDDGLKITEMPDGSLQVEWDEKDPRWSVFNTMSQEELQKFLVEALQQELRNNHDV
jgi:hypothetical protein